MKKRKYPFCILMALSVILFWGTLTVMGYTLGSSGEIVKREGGSGAETGTHVTSEGGAFAAGTKQAPRQENSGTEESTASSGQGMPETEAEPEEKNGQPETENGKSEERQFVQVDMSYLEGALFIGDSRTSTLYEYAGWDTTEFFVEYGLTIWDVMEEELAKDSVTGEKITVREALSRKQYEKIYLMLGINELGRGTPDTFYDQYRQVVDEIRSLQPDAVIFIQSIMHVTDKKDSEGTYINNTEINARNEKIKTLANQKDIFWLDENEVFDLEGTGKLNPDYTNDGVHLKAKYIPIWRDFFLEHGIEIDR